MASERMDAALFSREEDKVVEEFLLWLSVHSYPLTKDALQREKDKKQKHGNDALPVAHVPAELLAMEEKIAYRERHGAGQEDENVIADDQWSTASNFDLPSDPVLSSTAIVRQMRNNSILVQKCKMREEQCRRLAKVIQQQKEKMKFLECSRYFPKDSNIWASVDGQYNLMQKENLELRSDLEALKQKYEGLKKQLRFIESRMRRYKEQRDEMRQDIARTAQWKADAEKANKNLKETGVAQTIEINRLKTLLDDERLRNQEILKELSKQTAAIGDISALASLQVTNVCAHEDMERSVRRMLPEGILDSTGDTTVDALEDDVHKPVHPEVSLTNIGIGEDPHAPGNMDSDGEPNVDAGAPPMQKKITKSQSFSDPKKPAENHPSGLTKTTSFMNTTTKQSLDGEESVLDYELDVVEQCKSTADLSSEGGNPPRVAHSRASSVSRKTVRFSQADDESVTVMNDDDNGSDATGSQDDGEPGDGDDDPDGTFLTSGANLTF